jgi:hypothetical protein
MSAVEEEPISIGLPKLKKGNCLPDVLELSSEYRKKKSSRKNCGANGQRHKQKRKNNWNVRFV